MQTIMLPYGCLEYRQPVFSECRLSAPLFLFPLSLFILWTYGTALAYHLANAFSYRLCSTTNRYMMMMNNFTFIFYDDIITLASTLPIHTSTYSINTS